MRKWIVTLAVAGLLSSSLAAQQRSWTMHLAGGLSLPSGALNTNFNTGWHLLAGGWWSADAHPWGLRVDAAFNRFALSQTREFMFGGPGDRSAFSLTATGTYRLQTNSTSFTPYAMAGVGGYWTSCSDRTVCGSSTDMGWNFGAGGRMTVLGMQSFVEARYHTIGNRGKFFPLTVGVMF
jgi:hypothetical protein